MYITYIESNIHHFIRTKMDFSFLKSNRFWVMVVGCLAVAANGGFSVEAWLKALGVFAAGFIAVRTVDRATEKISQ